MNTLLQVLLVGLAIGSVYGLMALGFVLIYKCCGIFNFAHGAILMLMAYMCWGFLVQFQLPVWLSLLLTLVVAAVLGLVIERFTLHPLIGQPILAMMMVTLGIFYFLNGLVNSAWSGTGAYKVYPPFIPAGALSFGGIVVSQQLVWCAVVALLGAIFFTFFFQRSSIGLTMRATAEDHEVAQSMGIGVKGTFAIAWAISSVLCAIGGILLGSVCGINLQLSSIGFKVFPVVLLGGLESIPGAIVAGLSIGVLEKLAACYLDPLVGGGMEEAFPYFILILVLLIRPYGLFGLKTIERL